MESLLSFVQNYAALAGEIAVRQRRGYRMESWTYARIGEGANRLARELETRGINKGRCRSVVGRKLRGMDHSVSRVPA